MLTDHLLVICFLVVVQFHLPSTYYKNIEIWSEVFESRTVDNDNLARMFEIACCQESITRSLQLPFQSCVLGIFTDRSIFTPLSPRRRSGPVCLAHIGEEKTRDNTPLNPETTTNSVLRGDSFFP